MTSWHYRDYYTPSVPKKVRGGIKAQTQRGSFGQSWWAKRWIAVLESFNIGARLGRGRSYARKGQVVSISIEEGSVTAAVQGSGSRPYDVAISVKKLSAAEWKKVLTALSGQAIFAAKLLAGEMPENIEEIFAEQKLSLFPGRLKDLDTDCSCPDWSNPCKHIAAVYYLLGEEFDRDPFLIFKLRGMDRSALIAGLGNASDQKKRNGLKNAGILAREIETTPVLAPEPLPADPDSFWRSTGRATGEGQEVKIPKLHAGTVKQLGKFPMWRGEEPLVECLERIYSAASDAGLAVYLGTRGDSALPGSVLDGCSADSSEH